MAEYYHCPTCKKVLMLIKGEDRSCCPSCGGTRGEVLSQEMVQKGREAGTYFNIDLRTGKRAKKGRR